MLNISNFLIGATIRNIVVIITIFYGTIFIAFAAFVLDRHLLNVMYFWTEASIPAVEHAIITGCIFALA
jgi:hypothetical protein